MEQKLVALSGNEAVAYAFKQARPHVAAAFPITPQTEMMHKYADFVANGESSTEMILVESEHSAMSAAIGSAAAGARTFTATSSAGLRADVGSGVHRRLAAAADLHGDGEPRPQRQHQHPLRPQRHAWAAATPAGSTCSARTRRSPTTTP